MSESQKNCGMFIMGQFFYSFFQILISEKKIFVSNFFKNVCKSLAHTLKKNWKKIIYFPSQNLKKTVKISWLEQTKIRFLLISSRLIPTLPVREYIFRHSHTQMGTIAWSARPKLALTDLLALIFIVQLACISLLP